MLLLPLLRQLLVIVYLRELPRLLRLPLTPPGLRAMVRRALVTVMPLALRVAMQQLGGLRARAGAAACERSAAGAPGAGVAQRVQRRPGRVLAVHLLEQVVEKDSGDVDRLPAARH